MAKQHVCKFCSKLFASKQSRSKHQLTCPKNIQPKPKRICGECGYSSTRKDSFVRHKLKCKGLSKNVCEICNKTFKRKAHLTYHLKTHSKEDFKCTTCLVDIFHF